MIESKEKSKIFKILEKVIYQNCGKNVGVQNFTKPQHYSEN